MLAKGPLAAPQEALLDIKWGVKTDMVPKVGFEPTRPVKGNGF